MLAFIYLYLKFIIFFWMKVKICYYIFIPQYCCYLYFFLSIINLKYAHPTFTNHPVNAWKCCLNIMCEFHQRYPPGKEGRETLVISCHRIDAKLVLRQTMWKFHQITLDDECHRQKCEWERKKRVVFMYFWCHVIIGKYFQWKRLLYV